MSFKYTGTGPMKVAFFFSGGASSMKAVLESPEHRKLYNVVGALTNTDPGVSKKGRDVADQFKIPYVYLKPYHFQKRRDFYEAVTREMGEMKADVIGLSGWLEKYSIISDPLLEEYKKRILNVHPARLSIVAYLQGKRPLELGTDELKKRRRDLQGITTEKHLAQGWKRLYTGDDAVNMAVLFGEEDVCSTIFSVDSGEDTGVILVQSQRHPVDRKYVDKMLNRNAFDKVMEYGHDLQNRTKIECDGPAFCKALELLGRGRMEVFDDHVDLDGKHLPYGGFQMK